MTTTKETADQDIVERLRKGKSAGGYWREKEAADEIERLRKALKKIADDDNWCGQIARAALKGDE